MTEVGAVEVREARHGTIWRLPNGETILVSSHSGKNGSNRRAMQNIEAELRRKLNVGVTLLPPVSETALAATVGEMTMPVPEPNIYASPVNTFPENPGFRFEPVTDDTPAGVYTEPDRPEPIPVPETTTMSIKLTLPQNKNLIALDRLKPGQMAKDSKLDDLLIYWVDPKNKVFSIDMTDSSMQHLPMSEVKTRQCEPLPVGTAFEIKSIA